MATNSGIHKVLIYNINITFVMNMNIKCIFIWKEDRVDKHEPIQTGSIEEENKLCILNKKKKDLVLTLHWHNPDKHYVV